MISQITFKSKVMVAGYRLIVDQQNKKSLFKFSAE
jgi:hypothetical protein